MDFRGDNAKPFVIRRNINKTLIPPESPLFDEGVETNVRFVQGANAFIVFFQLYESFRVLYLHFVYKNECDDYSGLMLALGLINLFWIAVSLLGWRSINSKSSYKVKQFLFLLVTVAISRIAFYIVMIKVMGKVPNKQEWYCDAIYQGGLYIVTAGLEALVILVILILTIKIMNYLATWEQSQFASTTDSQYSKM